ncbi:hypothetical protein L1987_58903 [Smallanthus sonchifolius]|uniref:Uncharacterized protein n=1 Tax=Smallanthus sonchifolius TaxID=185202 RepID=A0ACB9D3N9_9ASTR|nr:hypothetical protein L1987_58903 [Smallanthus sonchifolius]
MLAQIQVSEAIIDIYKGWVRNKGPFETVMVDMKQWFGNLIVNMVLRMMFGNHFMHGEQNRDQILNAINRFVELLAALLSYVKEEVKEDLYGFNTYEIVKLHAWNDFLQEYQKNFGCTAFVASWLIKRLLEEEYSVDTSV